MAFADTCIGLNVYVLYSMSVWGRPSAVMGRGGGDAAVCAAAAAGCNGGGGGSGFQQLEASRSEVYELRDALVLGNPVWLLQAPA